MSLQQIIELGSKVWLDSVDPDEVATYRGLGATGATSNPAIIGDVVGSGKVDDALADLLKQGCDPERIAWELTHQLVERAQQQFAPIWDETHCNDGWVSFELDPLLEDPNNGLSTADRTERYVELGRKWSAGQPNRMIKVPATEAGLGALEALAADGITLNVTLIFSDRQYHAAREAVWAGAQKRSSLDTFKSVYSIFISRVDVYTQKQAPTLSADAQGQVGLVNVKKMYLDNERWWAEKKLPLQQEIVFASTGAKLEGDAEDKYVAALVGGGILTNPPKTNAYIAENDNAYTRTVDRLPPESVVREIEQTVDEAKMEAFLMDEGVDKFIKPHRELLSLIESRCGAMSGA